MAASFGVPASSSQTTHYWWMPPGSGNSCGVVLLRPWNLAHEPAAWKRLLVDHTDLAPHACEALSLVAIISLQLRESVQ